MPVTVQNQTLAWSLGLSGCLLVLAILSMSLGSVPIPFEYLISFGNGQEANNVWDTILWQIRLPRLIIAAGSGMGLAVAGSAYQSLFRNPLADPFVIGASSGAALGATIALAMSGGILSFVGSELGVNAAAFVGTLFTVLTVYAIGGTGRRSSPISLLLAGAAISTFFGSMVSLIVMLNDRSLSMVYYWLLGGFASVTWIDAVYMGAFTVPSLLLLMLFARQLDALALGDHTAHSLGLPVAKTRLIIVVVTSLLTAASVSVAGIVGFIGLIPPHMARALVGGSHRAILPVSALIGAVLLVSADLVARTALAPMEIPVGIITSMLGAPFFLYILHKKM